MRFLTDFADQAVILPLVLVVALLLALQGWRRGALVWLAVIGSTLAVILLLKLIFLGCTAVFGPVDLRSPSGHVAAVSVVTGGLVAVLSRNRRLVMPAVLLAALLIGLTRIGLHAHSWPEVALGASIGLAGALVLARYAGPPPSLRLRPLILGAILVLALFHGQHLQAEVVIRQAAWNIGFFPGWCRQADQVRL